MPRRPAADPPAYREEIIALARAGQTHRPGSVPLQPAAKKAFIDPAVSGFSDSRTRGEISARLESQAARVNQLLFPFHIAPDGSVWMTSRTEKEGVIVQVDDAGAPTNAIAVSKGIAVVQVGIGYFIVSWFSVNVTGGWYYNGIVGV